MNSAPEEILVELTKNKLENVAILLLDTATYYRYIYYHVLLREFIPFVYFGWKLLFEPEPFECGPLFWPFPPTSPAKRVLLGVSISHEALRLWQPQGAFFFLYLICMQLLAVAVWVCICVGLKICLNRAESQKQQKQHQQQQPARPNRKLVSSLLLLLLLFCGIVASFKASCELQLANMAWLLAGSETWIAYILAVTFVAEMAGLAELAFWQQQQLIKKCININ